MTIPKPPKEFLNWVDYAIANLDVRGAIIHTREEVWTAVVEEVDHLRRRASMPSFGILHSWMTVLSERLSRSEETLFENGLLATDFSDESVRIHFEDGTDLTFKRAFFVSESPAAGAICQVAVFTEHVGYHEFGIGPYDRIEACNQRPMPAYDLDDGPLTNEQVDALRRDVEKHFPRGKKLDSTKLF